jgi:hypothetical protein
MRHGASTSIRETLAAMSNNQMHIAAVFETVAAANAACTALSQAGIQACNVLVLDRGEPAATPAAKGHIWGRLKARLLPSAHAHHYAEAITRGHPLLLADIDVAQRDAAVAALQAHNPIDLQAKVDDWQAEGWSGTYEGEDVWSSSGNAEPASSDGVVGGGLIAGDYGAVGAPRATRADTDIQRGTVRLYRSS